MNTFLSSSQEQLLEQYASFVKEHVSPLAGALGGDPAPKQKLLQVFGQAGYLGLTVPKEYGGGGRPFIDVILMCEAIGFVEPGLCLILAAHYGAVELINKFGSATHKARYLPLLVRGEYIGAVAVNEEQAGTDYRNTKSEFANGKFSGAKTWVVNADIASVFVVSCRGADGAGATLQLVDAPDRSVLNVIGNRKVFGLSSAAIGDIKFQGFELGKESTLCDESQFEAAIQFGFAIAKSVLAAGCVGIVEGALALAAEHARTREQFGQKISQFQAIQWKLADMSTESSAARLLTYRAACTKDEKPADFVRMAAMCKLFASRVARIHSAEAVQILGTYGITEDSPAERFYRDAKVMEVLGGTSEAQKLVLVDELEV